MMINQTAEELEFTQILEVSLQISKINGRETGAKYLIEKLNKNNRLLKIPKYHKIYKDLKNKYK